MDTSHRSFSKRWVGVSMAMFIATELVIGGLVGEVLLGRMTSINTGFILQGLLNLAGIAIGGFIVGVISPGRRIAEPAAAGFATIVLIAILSIFVPFRMIGYTGSNLLIAGVFAAAIAGGGAYAGEKLTGNTKSLPGSGMI